MLNLSKEEKVETYKISSINAPIEEKRFCKDCRWYALLWLAFCCAMGGLVFPLIIIEVSEMPEVVANNFAFYSFISAVAFYFILRPSQIRKADREFKAINYHDHIHW